MNPDYLEGFVDGRKHGHTESFLVAMIVVVGAIAALMVLWWTP